MAARAGANQNVLHPESKAEHAISTLWWVMLAACAVGFGVIVILLFLGWLRRNRESLPFGGGDRAGMVIVVGLGVLVPIVILSLLFVWSDIYVLPTTEPPAGAATKLSVQVIGHDWFWEVRYPGTAAVTANEIHIPIKTPVDMLGTTADVIHSFWVPELNRKVDLIPGQVNRLLLEPERPGRYRGQCAEFCGLQHAHMAMYVFADPQPVFRAWLANMARPARKPRTALTRRGARLFQSLPCAGCHMIRGTGATGTAGPDLTHLASRTTLAALTIPNDSAALAGWIRDPQHDKPGNKMPGFSLTSGDTAALVAYLESLK
ncbi:MAG TPA: c-type cytochrome [Gaiellaceae bacterium]